jgi:nitrite reductase (NO-forming)
MFFRIMSKSKNTQRRDREEVGINLIAGYNKKDESLDGHLFVGHFFMKQFYVVLGIILTFLAVGFTYKYTLSPYADGNLDIQTVSLGTMSGMVSALPVVTEISADPTDIPPPITRKENTTVKISLEAIAVQSELADGVTYEYWTYNKQVPGPFIRVKEGDMVEVSLFHNPAGHSHAASSDGLDFALDGPFDIPVAHADAGHTDEAVDAHTMGTVDAANAHATHSVDLHSVLGPGGGAMLTQVTDGTTKTFSFKALRPGIYVYHCASPHIPTHIANGMYGMILVEPKEGMAKVDREFYVMQGEFYTAGKFGEQGLQAFSKEKLDMEHPDYVVFNGRVGSLIGDRALKAKTGETVRIFFGVGTFLPSNFHVIGGILDKLYPEGDIISPPHRNVQTTLVPAGGAMMTEMKLEVPGKFLLVDHALPRAIDKGAVGELVVEGADRPDIFRAME